MKEEILRLRAEGKTYNEIHTILGCSKGTIAYHCGEGQKFKSVKRQRKRRGDVLSAKIEKFKGKQIRSKLRDFQRRDDGKLSKSQDFNFTRLDVIKKIGKNPKCYLSGKLIDLTDPKSFHFDHIIPASRGGSNTLDNFGILLKDINLMKHDLTPEEFIQKCIEILEYQGYEIRKKGE